MTKIDIISGFLGAGKTTLIRKLLDEALKGQKIVLIGALIHEPEFLILDEPMVGLDPKSSYELKEVMRRRADAGKSVFFSTHVLEVAEKVCDKIAIINHGKIIASGTMDELRSLEHEEGGSLEKIFLELTENA